MGLDRPSDIAIIVGVGLLVILTCGLFITSIQTNQGVTQTSVVFTSADGQYNSSYVTSSNDASGALTNSPGASNQPSETNIATASFNAILQLGSMITQAKNLLQNFQDELGIPTYFLAIIGSMLLVTFAVITYSWFRGTQLP